MAIGNPTYFKKLGNSSISINGGFFFVGVPIFSRGYPQSSSKSFEIVVNPWCIPRIPSAQSHPSVEIPRDQHGTVTGDIPNGAHHVPVMSRKNEANPMTDPAGAGRKMLT